MVSWELVVVMFFYVQLQSPTTCLPVGSTPLAKFTKSSEVVLLPWLSYWFLILLIGLMLVCYLSRSFLGGSARHGLLTVLAYDVGASEPCKCFTVFNLFFVEVMFIMLFRW
jgi:hypothetical protein